jgi:transposase
MNGAKYVGMDVHQATISAVFLDSTGHLVMESIIETKATIILHLIQGLRGSLHAIFEEGTCAAWLHDLLQPHGTNVVVCDPRKNALLKAGNKNDRIDTRKLTTTNNRNFFEELARNLRSASGFQSLALQRLPR